VSLLTAPVFASATIDTSFGSVAIYFLALGELKKAISRLGLTNSRGNLSSKNTFVGIKKTSCKSGGVCFKYLTLAYPAMQ